MVKLLVQAEAPLTSNGKVVTLTVTYQLKDLGGVLDGTEPAVTLTLDWNSKSNLTFAGSKLCSLQIILDLQNE